MTQSYLHIETEKHENWLKVTLNNPKILNCLTRDMVEDLSKVLLEAEQDDSIKFIFLEGNGDRAFCAGGDVKSVTAAINPENNNQDIKEFFKWEYKADYTVHSYNKPIIAWMDGIVMGGGIGISNGASHRVMTEKSTWAMPEITIGLYPDVGATYFLNQLPGGLGLFVGLTGARLNSFDCLELGLSDFHIPSKNKKNLLAKLKAQDWNLSDEELFETLDALVSEFHEEPEETEYFEHLLNIGEVLELDSHTKIKDAMDEIDASVKNAYISNAIKTFEQGSPLSAAIIFEQLKRHQESSLIDCFVSEWTLSNRISEKKDFPEGVRALLIDKDNKPDWELKDLNKISAKDLEHYFKPYGYEEEYKEFLDDRSF